MKSSTKGWDYGRNLLRKIVDGICSEGDWRVAVGAESLSQPFHFDIVVETLGYLYKAQERSLWASREHGKQVVDDNTGFSEDVSLSHQTSPG